MLLTSLHPAAAHRRGQSSPTCKDCRRSDLFSVFVLKFTAQQGTWLMIQDPRCSQVKCQRVSDLLWMMKYLMLLPRLLLSSWITVPINRFKSYKQKGESVQEYHCVFVYLTSARHKPQILLCYFYFLARMSRSSPKPPCETNKAQLSSAQRNQCFCRK